MLPEWIKIKSFNRKKYLEVLKLIEKNKLNTVCIEANCPNRYDCFSQSNATFMILGNICTRNCLYCNVKKGKPKPIDKREPKKIANAVKKLNLKYATITCVTRDDLKDGGASQFVKVVREIRRLIKNCKIELLISDLNGNFNALKKIIECRPDVINHNIEIVEQLFSKIKPKGSYKLSLEILKKVKELNPKIITKSSFMVGFGENERQIIRTIRDLKKVKCDILIISQYLQPSKKQIKVTKYYSLKDFEKFEKISKKIGFKFVYSHPLARSSYKAYKYYVQIS